MRAISATLILTAMMGAGPALADDVDTRIFVDSLPPALQRQVMTAPIRRIGPFGVLAPIGCAWSRRQIPTAQGLKWVAEEVCSDAESGP
jgi:hypothetical protein